MFSWMTTVNIGKCRKTMLSTISYMSLNVLKLNLMFYNVLKSPLQNCPTYILHFLKLLKYDFL